MLNNMLLEQSSFLMQNVVKHLNKTDLRLQCNSWLMQKVRDNLRFLSLLSLKETHLKKVAKGCSCFTVILLHKTVRQFGSVAAICSLAFVANHDG